MQKPGSPVKWEGNTCGGQKGRLSSAFSNTYSHPVATRAHPPACSPMPTSEPVLFSY